MIKPPPTGRDGTVETLRLREWAYDAFRTTELSKLDVSAIHAIEIAFASELEPQTKGLLEGVLIFLRGIQDSEREQDDTEPGHPEAEDTKTAILNLLAGSDLPQRPSDIARTLTRSQPHVSRLLRALSDAGLVEADPDGEWEDGRAMGYGITADGRRALGLIDSSPDPLLVNALQQMLSEDQRRATKSLLQAQREDRRRENGDAAFAERPQLAIDMARQLGDPKLFLDAVGEYMTTLRHAGTDHDRALASRWLEALRRPLEWSTDQTYEGFREALWRYQDAKLIPDSNQDHINLLLEAEKFIREVPSQKVGDLGVWLYNALGAACQKSGSPIEAIMYTRQAYVRAHELGDWFAEVTVGARWAMMQRLSGDAGHAAGLSNRLLRRIEESDGASDYPLLRAECLYQRGESRRYQSRLDEADADLTEAKLLLGNDSWSARSRQVSFTHAALAALSFDQATSRQSDKDPDELLRTTEHQLMDVLRHRQSAREPDLVALTTRRLAVVKAHQDEARKAYNLAMEAKELYQDISTVGQIESIACAAETSRNPSRELQVIPELFLKLEHQASLAPGDGSVRLLDVWVRRTLERAARSKQEIWRTLNSGWQRLVQLDIAAGPSSDNGASSMGKEPLRLGFAA